MTWNLLMALKLIRELQPRVRELEYHICLGGGVLNTGSSTKDLDLFIIPLNGSESNPFPVLKYLQTVLGNWKSLRDSPDYGPDSHPHALEMVMFTYRGKRIDVFVQ